MVASVTYVEVMVLNLSCPAVSQICSFTFSPFTSMVRILKSTPIVVMYVPEGEYKGKNNNYKGVDVEQNFGCPRNCKKYKQTIFLQVIIIM